MPPVSLSTTVAAAKVPPVDFKYEKGVCALSWWEPIRLLEEGSISDIHLVRRRDKFLKVRYKEKRNVMELAKRKQGQQRTPLSLFRRTTSVTSTSSTTSTSDNNHHHHAEDDDKEYRVLKSIHKDHIGSESVLEEMRSEILVMSHLQHAHIVKLVEAYERRRHIYLIMEYCPGGNLVNQVHPSSPRWQAQVWLRQTLSALAYLHQHGVAHRDIKLENMMLDRPGNNVKLIDFGLATKYLSSDFSNMTDTVGTLYSMAPEVLERKGYDEKCDLWSVGVVAYMLLSGVRPFWGPHRSMTWSKRRRIMIDLIRKGDYVPMTEANGWGGVSEPAKTFVRSLLQLDPKARPTAQQAFDSEWIQSCSAAAAAVALEEYDNEQQQQQTQKQPPGSCTPTSDQSAATQDGSVPPAEVASPIMKHFTEFRRRAWRLLTTSQLTDDDVHTLETRLEEMDQLGTGTVDLKAFLSLLQELPSLCSNDQNTLEDCLFVDDDFLLEGVETQSTAVATTTRTLNNHHSASFPYIDFMIEVHVGRQRLIQDALASTLDDLDTTGTRTVVVADLLPLLSQPELRLSPSLQQELQQKVESLLQEQEHDHRHDDTNADVQGIVSTVPILEWFGKRIKQRQRDSVRSLAE